MFYTSLLNKSHEQTKTYNQSILLMTHYHSSPSLDVYKHIKEPHRCFKWHIASLDKLGHKLVTNKLLWNVHLRVLLRSWK